MPKVVAGCTNLVIVGAGGHGSEVQAYVRALMERGDRLHLVGFLDQGKPVGAWGATEILGDFPALESLMGAHPEIEFGYITAVGNNLLRAKLAKQAEGLAAEGLKALTVQHPLAWVGQEVEIGEGTCLAPGSIVTTRTHIGRHCILNVKATVSHDCEIGDFVNLNPGATICGGVQIGADSYIGAGATVINNIAIGEGVIVGAGAVVVEDIPARVTAVGVPARIIKRHT